MFGFGGKQQRRMLEAAFEPHGDRYLFYRHRWSFGIPVTEAEREEYLSIPVWGSRQSFYRKLGGRSTIGGRRDARQSGKRMFEAFPAGIAVVFFLMGSATLFGALTAERGLGAWLSIIAGAAMLYMGAQILAAKFRSWRSRGRDR